MTATVTRIILGIACVPGTFFVYLLTLTVCERQPGRRSSDMWWVADIVAAAILAFTWILIWGREVRWHSKRWIWTIGIATAAIIPGGVLFIYLPMDRGLGQVIAFVLWSTIWTGGTAVVWRESKGERAQRLREKTGGIIACPQCQYNMSGLYEARCPECGTQYTLDGLLASVRENQGVLRSNEHYDNG